MKFNLAPKLIILDRDGVLNQMVIDSEHGTVDSPLSPSQVSVYPWVPTCLRRLNDAGYRLHIATNQPAFRKGKTTEKNLHDTHAEVLRRCQLEGAEIISSEICLATREENSPMRKPEPGMLLNILARYPPETVLRTWMVGDGITDVEAGARAGVKTAFLGPRKCDHCKIFCDGYQGQPDYWGPNLEDFTRYVLNTA